jgi:hypothetical protein
MVLGMSNEKFNITTVKNIHFLRLNKVVFHGEAKLKQKIYKFCTSACPFPTAFSHCVFQLLVFCLFRCSSSSNGLCTQTNVICRDGRGAFFRFRRELMKGRVDLV